MASIIRPATMRCVAPLKSSVISRAAFSTIKHNRPARSSAIAANAVLKNSQAATFKTSSRREILPPLPQSIKGTVNEAADVPEPSSTHGAYHWTMERGVSVALIPLTIAPFAGGSLNPVLDATFVGLLIAHTHIGFQSSIIDYFPYKRLPLVRRGLEWALRIATLVAAIGFYEFETNDVGVTEAIKRIWKA